MANRRNRIIYASQSVFAEGRVLYRVQTLGSSTTFNTTDMFQLGELNLTDVVDDSPEVAVTIDSMDYGSIYTMATLAKIPTDNLHHNIRQSDGVTFFGTVSGSIDVSNGDLDDAAFAGLPAASGTGIANIVVRDEPGGTAQAYFHGAQLIDFARECGVPKGVDIFTPVQAECALGTANADIEFTKVLKDVFINSLELNYQSEDNATENYGGETEKKTWLLNDARFVSWEEWYVGDGTDEVPAGTMAAKTELQLALNTPSTVATLEKGGLGFLKQTDTGRPALLFVFKKGAALSLTESVAVPVFDRDECIPSNTLDYFLYDSSDNSLEFYSNGLASTLDALLPPGRAGAFENGDSITAFYAADGLAEEDPGSRPAGSDAKVVIGRYFAPISTSDVEDIGAVRQGQVEAYLVDPDLVVTSALTGATIGANSITFASTLDSSVDLTRFIGLPLRVTSGPGVGGPAREIQAATNNLVGDFNDGTVTLGGADWASIRLVEDTTQASTTSGVFVNDLCSVTDDYIGSEITMTITGGPVTTTISDVDAAQNLIEFPVQAGAPADGSDVFVSVEPTTASEIIVGDYQLSLRLQNVTFSADLTREALKEIGSLNPYARTVTIPIEFTVSIDATAGDLETWATFAGKLNEFQNDTLTDLDLTDLFTKDNLAVVVMVYQQNNTEAGGTGLDRRVNNPDMFGDEYYVNGVRNVYTATDGSLTEYPLKTVIAQNLRITDEEYSLSLGDNATQTYAFRGTNELTQLRGYIGVDLVTLAIESQGE